MGFLAYSHCKFEASNMFQQCWDSVNKGQGKLNRMKDQTKGDTSQLVTLTAKMISAAWLVVVFFILFSFSLDIKCDKNVHSDSPTNESYKTLAEIKKE